MASISSEIDRRSLCSISKEGHRGKVLEAIEGGGPQGSSFKEIRDRTGLRPTTLAYHLKVLTGLSLIWKGLTIREGRRDYTSYKLTPKGKLTLEALRSLTSERAKVDGTGPHGGAVLPGIRITYLSIGPRCISFPDLKR